MREREKGSSVQVCQSPYHNALFIFCSRWLFLNWNLQKCHSPSLEALQKNDSLNMDVFVFVWQIKHSFTLYIKKEKWGKMVKFSGVGLAVMTTLFLCISIEMLPGIWSLEENCTNTVLRKMVHVTRSKVNELGLIFVLVSSLTKYLFSVWSNCILSTISVNMNFLWLLCSSDKRASRPGSAHSNLTDLSQESVRDLDRPRTAQRRTDSKTSAKETVIFGWV